MVPAMRPLAISLGIAAAAALASSAPAVAAGPVQALPPANPPKVTEIAPGVGYQRLLRAGGEVVHVITGAPSPRVSLNPVLTAGSPVRRAALTEAIGQRLPAGAIAGVNGDFFNVAQGYPSGVLFTGGDLISEPQAARSALVLLPGGLIDAVRLALEGRFQAVDPTNAKLFPLRTFSGLNRPAQRSSETILYTPAYAQAATPTGSRYEVTVRLDAPGPLTPNVARAGTVIAVKNGGGTLIAPGQVVLTGVGSAGPALVSEFPLGRRVNLSPGLTALPAGALAALGGGPLLVRDGAAVPAAGEGFTGSQMGSRTSRTAVGQTADGTILLVTAEGPSQGSPGITVADQASLLASLGARTAMAMDAGGSAQMAVGTSLAIPWSSPRSVPDALLMYYDGVRIETLPFRLSANADRVDDSTTVVMRSPRAGVARLTIAHRTGRPTKRLWEGRLGPGSVRVLLDPRRIHLADGVYTVVANFTPDDGSGVTEQRRRVILDRTLGSLSARAESRRVGKRVVARLDVGFVLAHSARVSARVESTSGGVLHRLAAGKVMRPGRHSLSWNRRSGSKVVSGSVRVIVEARGRLGTSGLVRAVTLRPPPKPAAKGAAARPPG
jgi:Phosphodiester glycosidase